MFLFLGIVHVKNFFGKSIMMFVTKSIAKIEENLKSSEEGMVQWILLENVKEKNFQIFKDIPFFLEKILNQNCENNNEIFTAKSEFDGQGELLSLTFR